MLKRLRKFWNRRDRGSIIKAHFYRIRFQLFLGVFSLGFFVVAYLSFVDPQGWIDSATGQPVSPLSGRLLGIPFAAGGLAFGVAIWWASGLKIDLNAGTKNVTEEEDQKWQINAEGLVSPGWHDNIIPWSVLERVEDNLDETGQRAICVYFVSKQAAAHYLGDEAAKEWTADLAYPLSIVSA
jgi:hypothetical protein